MSVVLLDPFEEEREMYTTYLRASGFDVWPHEHATDAWRTLATERPDALVLRLRQSRPEMNGIDFVRRVRRSRSTSDLAVVMITTSMRPEDKDAACNAGADAYLLLPVRPDEIVAEVRRAMRLGRSTAGRKQSGALHQGARNVGPRGGKRS
jgi:DNA-binding response OmpR family regulator